MEEQGFYKADNGELLYAAVEVSAPTYHIEVAKKDEYELPIDGWRYFDTREQAGEYYGINLLTNEIIP